ncbi:MAG: phospholipid carrier-dependent glycosyltransferase [Planctomycetia bacterium]|nr:phospholipid carrier-dependent glycosyltransferase [Planctomycetia bacterium]
MFKCRLPWCLIFLLILTAVVRGGLLVAAPQSLLGDPDRYYALANNLRTYGVFGEKEEPTAFRPPLYPFALRQMFRLADMQMEDSGTASSSSILTSTHGCGLTSRGCIAFFHTLLGLLTVFLVVRTGMLLGLTRTGSLAAGLLVAVDPILLAQSRVVMTETLATFLAILIWWILAHVSLAERERSRYALTAVTGLLTGVATLCRPAFLGWAGLVALALLLTRRGRAFSPGQCVTFLLGLTLVILPWTVRNFIYFNRVIPTTTHDGYTLLLANNDYLYDWYEEHAPWEKAWDPTAFHAWWSDACATRMAEAGIKPGSRNAELFQNDLAREESLKVIRNRPCDFVKSMAIRFGTLVQCLPYNTVESGSESTMRCASRVGVAVFYLMEFTLVVFGTAAIARRFRTTSAGQRPAYRLWLWGGLLILSVVVPHLFFWTNMRMRSVLMVAIAIVAAASFGLRPSECLPKEDALELKE